MFQRTKGVDDTGERDVASNTVAPSQAAEAGERSTRISKRALIGSETRVTGDMTGEEDLHIEGHIVGSVTFRRHAVSVSSDGSVEGDVVAQSLTIGGTIRGRLIASHSVRVLAGAHVSGEIHSPGLVIEEGAEFQGTVDMNPDSTLLEQSFDTALLEPVHQAPTDTWQAGAPDDDYPESTALDALDEEDERASHRVRGE
ncbi:bactofilin family protein [Kushneria indalinina]|uniref:Polymer-forming protein n=1 Tax=Kushneria indalinina DSM 14324 TaxID=1122140 RepID=A0A3D9DUI9_9GAMM|nr:polymer-forming cytoskeletal protein [Kushneria indalinina]REC94059.1 polymer-forming protein [Kushneria indalinina DSM 14324]